MKPSISFFLAAGLAAMVLAAQPLSAQTLTVLHTFTNGTDGGGPTSGLTMDASGKHLYGTALTGGTGYGTIFRLTDTNGDWTFSTLYEFQGDNGNNDGAGPFAKVIVGPNGTLYGTTVAGGGNNGSCADYGYYGCGTVFNLQPPPTICRSITCYWRETVLNPFVNGPGGVYPLGAVLFDHAGNMFGTTEYGGTGSLGSVYELSPSGSGWQASQLLSFTGDNGVWPYDTLVMDSAGNLYGGTRGGGSGYGLVFELSPNGSGWTENILHEFDGNDGEGAVGGLVFDSAGNLYGTTWTNGSGGGGTVFELSPSANGWQFNLLYSFAGCYECGPADTLAIDAAGNLYGTTYKDGANGQGNVFKLTNSNGQWTYTDLYDFNCNADGAEPNGGPVLDSGGNIYGTTTSCGAVPGYGTVWKLTQ
ncbi:MAG TPA: choice-of-anchor tandem repeat GloVer-containing protein [Bryocella sp.]|nr:choice-of-anchor tandem repeat GloVer-containing protein [Bryocella sp.]